MKKLLITALIVAAGCFSVFKDAYTAPGGINIGAVVKQTPALATNLVLKSKCAPLNCVLTSFEVSADSTLSPAIWTILIYDAATAPADGAVTPAKCYILPTGTTNFSAAFNIPAIFNNGVVIVISTGQTCFTQTTSGGAHAFISGDVQ
jgi:hypothetical protein